MQLALRQQRRLRRGWRDLRPGVFTSSGLRDAAAHSVGGGDRGACRPINPHRARPRRRLSTPLAVVAEPGEGDVGSTRPAVCGVPDSASGAPPGSGGAACAAAPAFFRPKTAPATSSAALVGLGAGPGPRRDAAVRVAGRAEGDRARERQREERERERERQRANGCHNGQRRPTGMAINIPVPRIRVVVILAGNAG